jgi:ATP-binding cassette subfamily B protein
MQLSPGPFFKDLRRAISLIWLADKNIGRINILLQVCLSFLPIASLYCMKLMIEAVVHGNKSFDIIIRLIIIYGAIQLLSGAAGQLASFVNGKHQLKLTDALSNIVLKKAISVDYEYYENPEYHDTLHLAQQQALGKAPQLLGNLNALLLNILSLVFLTTLFLTLHSAFALAFMAVSIPLAAIKWYSGFALLQLDKKFVPLEREAGYLHQTLTGINPAKEVRVFGYGDYFIEKFNAIRLLITKEKTKLNARLTWYSFFAETGELIAMLVFFGFLAKYTWQKTVTVGAFVIYIQGFQRLQSSSASFLQALVQIFQQRIFLKDLFIFFDLHTGNTKTGTKPFPESTTGLKVDNISFTYPDMQRMVLDQVSLACKPGSVIAIVGENGSGKSTLVKLLARLYDVDDNGISIDGCGITDIDMQAFRKETVFLFQDFEKYFLTVDDNITLGDFSKNKDVHEIERAAQLADADKFIQKLNKGYNTRIGRLFRGSEQLSGGQWQKLALSRIFYRKVKLVILDEPTSSLDPVAEFEVFQNIKKQMKHQMVILITHRLYNLKIADYIYVLKDGRVNQEGTFEKLSTEQGEFKKMFDNQKL